MELSDLRIFRAVVDEGGITRAAEKLLRVQSSVTTRIKQLEEDLGTPLFLRQGKKLHLTPAGHTLLDYARRLQALADEARDAVQDPHPKGLFRLGAMESTAAVRLPVPLSEYYRRFPDVDLQLRTGNPVQLATAILAGEIDAALVAEPVAEGRFDHVSAFEEDLILVAKKDHPPIGKSKPLPSTIIAFEQGCPHRKRLETWYERRGDMPKHTIQLSSYHAMLGCVVVGMGVALIPGSVLDTFPDSHLLSRHQPPSGLDRAATLLIWRKGAVSPKINALIEVLGDQGQSHMRDGRSSSAT
ncbi:LysR substrate-binding domain-containing protein [Anderseniella sp. Alg231-50]|uniref:LysR substrate-binding domain-containing protein n=1 Tax=Anderseniella sp. Alg231-50 TaxID=1922226 RepID=UPI000D551E31